jgi:hypothetical protein
MPAPGFCDTDTAAGLGDAVSGICAMGFPAAAARFALETFPSLEEAVAFLLEDNGNVDVAAVATTARAGTAPPRPGASPAAGAGTTATEGGTDTGSGDGVIGMAPPRPSVPSAPPACPDSAAAADASSATAAQARNWRLNPVRQRGGWRVRRKTVQHTLKQAKAAGDAGAIAAAEQRLKAADCRPARQQTTTRASAVSPSGPGRKGRRNGRAKRAAAGTKKRKRADKAAVGRLVREVRHLVRRQPQQQQQQRYRPRH